MSDRSKQIAKRFQGPNGQRLLHEVLRKQSILENNEDAITAVASKVKIEDYEEGESIIIQGGTDTDIFFILAGSVVINNYGREVERRPAGAVVGLLAAMDPSSIRLATVKACAPTVAARIAEVDLASIADMFPFLWRRIAKELVNWLRVAYAGLSRPTKPRVFIASSTEAIDRANALCDRLRLQPEIVDVDIWDAGVFEPGLTYIEALESELAKADFAVLFFSADDYVVSRGQVWNSPRDNIIFELGLFVGAFTRRRALIVHSDGVDLKIPTDLLGVNTIKYKETDIEKYKENDLQQIIDQLARIFKTYGPR